MTRSSESLPRGARSARPTARVPQGRLWVPQGPCAVLRRDRTGHRSQSHRTSLLAVPGLGGRAAPPLGVPGTQLAQGGRARTDAVPPHPPPSSPERGPRASGTGGGRARRRLRQHQEQPSGAGRKGRPRGPGPGQCPARTHRNPDCPLPALPWAAMGPARPRLSVR